LKVPSFARDRGWHHLEYLGGRTVPGALSNVVVFVPDSGFYPLQSPHLQPALTATESIRFDGTPGFPIPQWKYYATNRVVYALIDKTTGIERLVDFVNLDNQLTTMDITKALVGATNFLAIRRE